MGDLLVKTPMCRIPRFLLAACVGFTALLTASAPVRAEKDRTGPAGPVLADVETGGLARLDFREVIASAKDEVFPAVVFIKCVRQSHEEGKRSSQEVSGSGVIISPGGEVLTNWHVVDKAIEVRCLLYDGQAMHAEVVGTDKDTDLALLKLKKPEGAGDLAWARIGDSSALREGDFVMAMGAPWGMSRSVTIGIISARRRYLPENSEYSLWLQTDAAISPGNSGGPLINTEGQVIGINTRGVMFGGDMGFAVPAETIQRILPEFRKHGEVRWSWTGLLFQPLRDFNRDMYFDATEGVMVAGTEPQSPARRAGIQTRDRIVSLNGEALTAITEEDLPAVRRAFGNLPLDQAARVEIVRGDEALTIELTPREKGKVEGEELDCPRWDLTVKTINQFDNPRLYFYRKEGVFIFGIRSPGNAAFSGLQTEDIILKIDDQKVTTLEDVKAIHERTLENLGTKHRAVFTVLRNGLMRQIVLDYARDFEKE